MIYPIVVYGDPVLKKRAEEIKKDEMDVKALAADMFETMYNASGVGLAAPQIGISKRIFVVDGSGIEEPELMDFKMIVINPTIKDEEGKPWLYEEGCLSIPNIREDILRNPVIRLHYFDEEWNEHEDEFTGMQARILQHEYDHLEGILFTDYLTPFKKRILKGKLLNISKGKVDAQYPIKAPMK